MELIDKLVAILRETDSDRFNEAVKMGRELLEAEAKQARARMFDSQIATLKDRGTPEQIVEILHGRKGAVLAKANEMTIKDGNIPFLPVIPRSFRSLYDLIAMVRNGYKAGYNYLNPTHISDVVDAPQELYYIYDVEDGNSTRCKSPQDAEKIIQQQKRSPLTMVEVTALTTHMDVLSKHYVWAVGSRYESANGVPHVYLAYGARPKLDWGDVGSSDSRGGSPSCGSR